jgi:hypothetical protein
MGILIYSIGIRGILQGGKESNVQLPIRSIWLFIKDAGQAWGIINGLHHFRLMINEERINILSYN